LNVLAKNWCQNVLISAKSLDRPSRLFAVEERDSDVMVVMTRPAFSLAACAALEAPFGALMTVLASFIKTRFQLS
jgi:hypothetical protein